MSNENAVKVQVFKGDELVVVEKNFKTPEARDAWLDKQEDAGKLNQVLAWGR